jgi:hypothetical protein
MILVGLCALASGCAVDNDEPGQQEDNFTSMPSLDFPEESEWAKGRIGKACGIAFTDDRVEGFITETDAFTFEGETYPAGILYEADFQGETIAAAWASSTTLWADMECLYY